jgi:hypothetical protein
MPSSISAAQSAWLGIGGFSPVMVAGMFVIFVFPGFYAPTLVGDSPHIGMHWKSAIVEYDPKNENRSKMGQFRACQHFYDMNS